MSVSILLMKLKGRVAVCWSIALWEDPEGVIYFPILVIFLWLYLYTLMIIDPANLESELFILQIWGKEIDINQVVSFSVWLLLLLI